MHGDVLPESLCSQDQDLGEPGSPDPGSCPRDESLGLGLGGKEAASWLPFCCVPALASSLTSWASFVLTTAASALVILDSSRASSWLDSGERLLLWFLSAQQLWAPARGPEPQRGSGLGGWDTHH